MKYIVLLGDGMADRPLPDQENRTPLCLSDQPVIDRLACHGRLGMVQTIPEGYEPGSDVANLAAMGYDPRQYYTGRAPIEAASIGVELGPRDVAFRCNLVSLRDTGDGPVMHDYSAGHITTADAHQVIAALKPHLDSADITLYPGVSYRHLLVWRNGEAGMRTVPPHDISDRVVTDSLPAGDGAERIRQLMETARQVLAGLPLNRDRAIPANAIWLWGQGTALQVPSFAGKYQLSGSVISAVDLVKGLGICAGLNAISVPGATGYLDTNYDGKVAAAIDALQREDFVYLHVEAPDEASHKGSFAEKRRAIEDFDRKIVGPVIAALQQQTEPFRVLVMPDHPTPLEIKTHSSEPVPFIICSGDDLAAAAAAARRYCEADATATGDLVPEGWTLMDAFIGK